MIIFNWLFYILFIVVVSFVSYAAGSDSSKNNTKHRNYDSD